MRPVPLLFFYVAIALAPLILAYAQGLEPRGFLDELSSALGMVGFAMLLTEFVLSGRFKTVSRRIGIDITMRFHQLTAHTLVLFIIIHPFLYTSSGDNASIGTGLAAWILLPVLVVMAMFRSEFPYRYENWRITHGVGAALIAALGMHHALTAGRYSENSVLAIYWFILLSIAFLALAYIYLLKPFWQLRNLYIVVSVKQIALKMWEVVVEPRQGNALAFEAGQFVWLTLGRSPFAVTEHPFSISSCPGDRPRIAFTIKEVGDFTSTIGALPVGSCAYLDGPHGNLTLRGASCIGIVFIAGGVGLAPIMSILRQLRADKDQRPLKLLYGNRIPEQIMYQGELNEIKGLLDLDVHYLLSEPPPGWEGPVGQFDEKLLADYLNFEQRERWLYIVCGPAAMIDSVEDSLGRLDVPLRQIISERFEYM